MISVRYILLSVLLVLVNGCSTNKALESRFAPLQTKNPDEIKTEVSPTVETPKNTSEVKLPDNFPKEIPIYAQAKLVSVDGKQTNWTSSDPLNLITEYYQQELIAQKWTISQKEDNLIIATKPDSNESMKLSLTPRNGETEFTLSYESAAGIMANPVIPENNNTLPSSISKVNESSSSLDELVRLNIISSTEKLNPYQPITRREYARWLVKVNNLLYADVNSKLIRLANPQSKPIFTDIAQNDPDFAIIQGLAEAGLIPSTLTQDSNAITFKPDTPLTREDLIMWKLPLDFRQKLPNATLDTIKETWGFQDAAKIKPQTWRQLYVDWQNGEESNIRRGFGYITLFQPQKPVTYEETARILSIFGYQGDIRNLQDVKN
ncbi:MAG: S-layer protein [Cyanobacteria bacterium]|nr:S-layer protein [Cyanobacteria bacterium CG_2015-16_32_12]NCO77263.1 S-layer protein [Cyanobacteria bacterium CG_2015-22_32_23]NCQ05426.1 S-layer protein [Cyanobacteria bacterium CG_2015-09_32_10]NCQ41697.1 S-layer protein [Cyanobacteria bacterium CG_2015-04_32_10]NCS85087.1 S-layer protein [Cyanobacteria bacterium CG_2015-02_32_10]